MIKVCSVRLYIILGALLVFILPSLSGQAFFFSSRRRHTRFSRDWSSDVCSSDLAAWDIGCIVRWLDYNDTWLAAEWGHPSDNLGAILAVADHLSQKRVANGQAPLAMKAVLEAMILAHEIQGVLALENSFNRVGLDHVVLVKVASTAVSAKLMGANREQMLS